MTHDKSLLWLEQPRVKRECAIFLPSSGRWHAPHADTRSVQARRRRVCTAVCSWHTCLTNQPRAPCFRAKTRLQRGRWTHSSTRTRESSIFLRWLYEGTRVLLPLGETVAHHNNMHTHRHCIPTANPLSCRRRQRPYHCLVIIITAALVPQHIATQR